MIGSKLLTPRGITSGALKISRGRIAAIRRFAPKGARTINVHDAYIAPGFIDLHVWGTPATLSRDVVKGGATAFLFSVGPAAPQQLLKALAQDARETPLIGARCLGAHLEGPFLNPTRGGVLSRRWMRIPTGRELAALARGAAGRIKLITLAPELRGAREAIRWCGRHRIVASLGHSDASAQQAAAAIDASARAATHVFNGMRPFHHRQPALLDVVLTDDRVTAMVIADGIHVSPHALRLLVRAKGPERIALVTDSVRQYAKRWRLRERRGAFYSERGVLAGSALTMIQAVHNMVTLAGVSLIDAVRMASAVPARLLGIERRLGTIETGKRADLVAFDGRFRVRLAIVGGAVAYNREAE
ncbi:MAG: N-acetylglucosamine-6-phosphate deacetylase [Candidatus Omnitrophica bacterium]|nr:N-acetylglucosamine-6-phosphate deacetylase [Candidatus Omnitrophota bacterium]